MGEDDGPNMVFRKSSDDSKSENRELYFAII